MLGTVSKEKLLGEVSRLKTYLVALLRLTDATETMKMRLSVFAT